MNLVSIAQRLVQALDLVQRSTVGRNINRKVCT